MNPTHTVPRGTIVHIGGVPVKLCADTAVSCDATNVEAFKRNLPSAREGGPDSAPVQVPADTGLAAEAMSNIEGRLKAFGAQLVHIDDRVTALETAPAPKAKGGKPD
jgi:hypothetical protein